MDPTLLTTDQWGQISLAIRLLWLAFGSAILGGILLAVAHAIIPSAVDTKTISAIWAPRRKLFYVTAVVFLIATAALLISAISISYEWISEIYPRYWK